MTRAARLHAHGLRTPARWFGRTALTLALACGMSGCVSYSYVDRDNVRHVVGFMNVAIDQSKPAQASRVTVLGVAVGRDPIHGGSITLGYRDDRLLAVSDHACVDLQVPAVCAATQDPKGSVP
jgi:hypothetical protein